MHSFSLVYLSLVYQRDAQQVVCCRWWSAEAGGSLLVHILTDVVTRLAALVDMLLPLVGHAFDLPACDLYSGAAGS
jgi:hypothetical protein